MDFNRYFDNETLEAQLRTWAEEYPALVELGELGWSYEKRPIWLLTLTNRKTGEAGEKPGVWLDANIHATEIAGTTTVLRIAHSLLTGYGQDERLTRQLDESVYYLAPRLNPDGAALALAAKPRYLRSGVRAYPWPDKEDGLHSADVDGDGRILQMRFPDPNGEWKVSSLDSRLMEKRGPTEHGGDYYRILPEGTLENFDGHVIKIARPPEGLDFNRNFPFLWRPEDEQRGAGPYPASEPEIRAVMDFLTRHLNVNAALSFHTFSRVILRPYSTRADDEMPVEDLWVFQELGRLGTELTGYRCVSTFHDFKYHPKEVTTGAFDDWLYDHLGVFTYTIEQWDLPTEAGIENRKFIEWYRLHPHEDDLKILQWVTEHAPEGYVDWYPYEHPQLGPVELGGWNHMYTWRNPPPAWMGAEAERNTRFALALGDLLPRLQIYALEITQISDDDFHIELMVENTGYLPTCTSEQGKKRKAVRPVRAELTIPREARLVQGKPRVDLGHLEGRSNKFDAGAVYAASPTDNRARAEWVVAGRPGARLELVVTSERAGIIRRTIELSKKF